MTVYAFVLIIGFRGGVYQGSAVATAEFGSEQACKIAAAAFLKENDKAISTPAFAMCVRKTL